MEVDASKHDLGAVLLQDSKPVGYASKTLTPTEQEYAQIEEEMYRKSSFKPLLSNKPPSSKKPPPLPFSGEGS